MSHEAACPTLATAEFQYPVRRAEFHALPHGFRDGRMMLLHRFAAPLFGPAVEAPPEERIGVVRGERPANFDGLGEIAERAAQAERPRTNP